LQFRQHTGPASATATATVTATATATASMDGQEHALAPLVTGEDDWKPVADALGRAGTLNADKTVYRVPLPRRDTRCTLWPIPTPRETPPTSGNECGGGYA